MKYLLFGIFLIVVVAIYRPWFAFGQNLSGGDWPYLYKENIEAFKVIPDTSFIWLEPYYNLTAKIGTQFLGLNWEITEKIFWFLPFLIISILSSWLFLDFIFKDLIKGNMGQLIKILGSLIFIANTYILMIVGGGQMGVAMAYALSPLIFYFYFYIQQKEKVSILSILVFSLVSALQFMFDPRIFIATLTGVFLHLMIITLEKKKIDWGIVRKLIIANSIAFIVNLFWVFPNVVSFREEYTRAATELSAKFLSFANFSNSISLLHPNWPENIFGKLSFMRPEFLIISIVSFSVLYFLPKDGKKRTTILFFVLLGLFSSFLAKGTNEPFPQIFNFISNLPGATLFRDSTKFYILTAISYSIIFPLGIYNLGIKLGKGRIWIQYSVLLFSFSFLLFLIAPSFKGELSGTFSPQSVPSEYISLKNFLYPQGEFSVLWFPQKQRYGFESKRVLSLNAFEIIPNSWNSPLINNFKKNDSKSILSQYNVKYVILPYDTKREIFMNDRKYDEKVYEKDLVLLQKIPWLKEIKNEAGESKFGKIVVFEVIY